MLTHNIHTSSRILPEVFCKLDLSINENNNSVSFKLTGRAIITKILNPAELNLFKLNSYQGTRISTIDEYNGMLSESDDLTQLLNENIILAKFKYNDKNITNQCDIHFIYNETKNEYYLIISRMFSSKYFPKRDSSSYYFKIKHHPESTLVQEAWFNKIEGDNYIENILSNL